MSLLLALCMESCALGSFSWPVLGTPQFGLCLCHWLSADKAVLWGPSLSLCLGHQLVCEPHWKDNTVMYELSSSGGTGVLPLPLVSSPHSHLDVKPSTV